MHRTKRFVIGKKYGNVKLKAVYNPYYLLIEHPSGNRDTVNYQELLNAKRNRIPDLGDIGDGNIKAIREHSERIQELYEQGHSYNSSLVENLRKEKDMKRQQRLGNKNAK